MTDSPITRWRVTFPGGLLWAHWGAYAAIFNPTSGETHLLSALPVELLSLLVSNPDSFDSLAERLSKSCEVCNDAAWAVKVQALLDSLELLDLVERVEA